MVYAASKAKLGHLKRKDGYHTGGVFGTVRMVERAIEEHGADRVYLCLDAGGTSRRREIDPSYKSGREDSTAAVLEEGHLEDIIEWARTRGVHVAWAQGYEADDVIAELHSEFRRDDWERKADATPVFVLTRDHDARALLDDSTQVVWPKDKPWTKERFLAEHGFEPSRYEDFLALAGDPTDAVPAVCDKQSALKFLGGSIGLNQEQWEMYARNSLLVTQGFADPERTLIVREPRPDRDQLAAFYRRLEFNSLLKKIDEVKLLCS
jgi:DNA polymerase-1